jgi:hypothetical protein
MTTPGIFLIPKEIVKKAGLWDENLSLLDDTEYFTRTILAADMVIFSSRSTLYYNSGIKSSLSGFKTRKGFESAFTAIEKATTAFLNKKSNKHTQLLCANFWQLFIYDSYPYHKDLLRKAKMHLQKLEQASLPFPCGGYSKLLLPFLGWKTTKRLQLINKEILKTYNKAFSKNQNQVIR